MRNSEGVPKEGNTHIFSSVTKNDPGPAGGLGALPDSGMVCCDTWREGRRTGPARGFARARKKRPTNGGRPSGPTLPGRPNSLPPSAASGTRTAVHNGTSELQARATIEPGCGGTMIMHMGPSPGELQGLGPSGPHPLKMAEANRRGKNRDPPHPNCSGARPAGRWSLCNGRGERCTEGPLRVHAGPCRQV